MASVLITIFKKKEKVSKEKNQVLPGNSEWNKQYHGLFHKQLEMKPFSRDETARTVGGWKERIDQTQLWKKRHVLLDRPFKEKTCWEAFLCLPKAMEL